MSDHEHAYLICENKCLVEGLPKSDLYTKTEVDTKLGGKANTPYTGSDSANTNYPVGTNLIVDIHPSSSNRYLFNSTVPLYLIGNTITDDPGTGNTPLVGTWKSRGTFVYSNNLWKALVQRVA